MAGVTLEDLDPLRINVEADLTRRNLHRGSQRYPVTSADALSDRELDRERTGGVNAQSGELRIVHSTIFVAWLEVCRQAWSRSPIVVRSGIAYGAYMRRGIIAVVSLSVCAAVGTSGGRGGRHASM